jgi:hypothetical protein
MKARTLFIVASLIMLPVVSNGQISRFLKNRANNAANVVERAAAKEVDKEVESAVQKKADKIADSINKHNEKQGGLNMSKLFSGKVDIKYNDEYNFTSRLWMQTESYEKKDVAIVDLFIYSNSSQPIVGMETKSISNEKGKSTPVSSEWIMDGENKCFIILTDADGSKMGIISSVNEENNAPTQPDVKPANKPDEKPVYQPNEIPSQRINPTGFTKTGNTRVIAGYRCDEYSYTDPENKVTGKLWFTKDANLKIDKRGWQKTGMGAYYGYAGFGEGIILATESYDENGKLTMKSETKEINPNYSHSISTKGYTLRQLNLNLTQAQDQKK